MIMAFQVGFSAMHLGKMLSLTTAPLARFSQAARASRFRIREGTGRHGQASFWARSDAKRVDIFFGIQAEMI
jgi:hypothetical protein